MNELIHQLREPRGLLNPGCTLAAENVTYALRSSAFRDEMASNYRLQISKKKQNENSHFPMKIKFALHLYKDYDLNSRGHSLPRLSAEVCPRVIDVSPPKSFDQYWNATHCWDGSRKPITLRLLDDNVHRVQFRLRFEFISSLKFTIVGVVNNLIFYWFIVSLIGMFDSERTIENFGR